MIIVETEGVEWATRFFNGALEAVGKLAGQPLLTSFKDTDRRFSVGRPLCCRQSGCRHRSAITGADDDDIVAVGAALIPIIRHRSSVGGVFLRHIFYLRG